MIKGEPFRFRFFNALAFKRRSTGFSIFKFRPPTSGLASSLSPV